jgi:DNA-binding LacI/PurR family transcriptional regulator
MIDWLRKRGLPLVLVDQTPIPGVAAVNVDDQGGARLAAEHLLALGHRRIGIVTVGVTEPYGLQEAVTVEPLTQESYIARQRIRGWLGALSSAGVSPLVVKQPKMPYRPETDGYAALTMLLDADPEITGVLCFGPSPIGWYTFVASIRAIGGSRCQSRNGSAHRNGQPGRRLC